MTWIKDFVNEIKVGIDEKKSEKEKEIQKELAFKNCDEDANKRDDEIKKLILSTLDKLGVHMSLNDRMPFLVDRFGEEKDKRIWIGKPNQPAIEISTETLEPILKIQYMDDGALQGQLLCIFLEGMSNLLVNLDPLEEVIVLDSIEVWHPKWKDVEYYLSCQGLLLRMEQYPDPNKFQGWGSGYRYRAECEAIDKRNARSRKKNAEAILKVFNTYKNFLCSFKVYKRKHFEGKVTITEPNGVEREEIFKC